MRNSIGLIQEKVNSLGLVIEILELQGIDYLLVMMPGEESELNNQELMLLAILAVEIKIRGGFIQENQLIVYKRKFSEFLSKFIDLDLVMYSSTGELTLSPLGAMKVLPFLKETENLINIELSSIK